MARARAGRAGIAGAVLAGAVTAGALAGCTSTSTPGSAAATGGSAAQATSASGSANAVQQQYQNVVRSVLPSVVEISTSSTTGSGVVYDDKGDIVTNAHVVSGANAVQVLTSSASSVLQAKVIGTFAPDDLAVVRVTSHADSLRPATFSPSGAVTTGQIVLAMGSPLGLSGTVTQGIISATGRTVTESSTAGAGATTIVDALQTSAAINSGNSGGALVDLAGHVIGIPTAAAQNPASGGQAAGIGFAIPSDTVTNIAGQLITTGKVSNSGRAALGITASNHVSSSGQAAGVNVVAVTSGGAAEKAGIRAGDVITALNGEQTLNQAALTSILATLSPGDKVPVQYSRAGSLATTMATLGSLHS